MTRCCGPSPRWTTVPTPSARSLRSAQTRAIGLLYDNPNPYYVIAMQTGVLSVCREAGAPARRSTPAIQPRLPSHRTSSAIFAMHGWPAWCSRRHVRAADAGGGAAGPGHPPGRIVSGSRDPEDGSACVFVDDHDAAYDITVRRPPDPARPPAHRLPLGGPSHKSSGERYEGYGAEALRDYGIALDPELVVEGDYSFDDVEGFRGARRLLALELRPTAIFGSNDEIAAGVLAAARSGGLNVPYDLSIAGFEDSPFSRQSWPALTTARQATRKSAATPPAACSA